MNIEIIQSGTGNIPKITYDHEEGVLSLTGRSISERPDLIYTPLEEWIRAHFNRFTSLRIVIFLEYINSGSSKALRDILRLLGTYHPPEYRIRITWLYEEDDEAMHELGEHYREAAGVNMEVQMVL